VFNRAVDARERELRMTQPVPGQKPGAAAPAPTDGATPRDSESLDDVTIVAMAVSGEGRRHRRDTDTPPLGRPITEHLADDESGDDL